MCMQEREQISLAILGEQKEQLETERSALMTLRQNFESMHSTLKVQLQERTAAYASAQTEFEVSADENRTAKKDIVVRHASCV
jgi:hypothetical protein